MKKDFFRLRHAALVSALALAMGSPLAFADEAPLEVPVAQPAVEGDAGAVSEPVAVVEPVVEPVVADEPVTVDEPVAVDEPPAGDEVVTIDDPAPGDEVVTIDEPVPGDEVVTLDDPVPGGEVVTLDDPVAVDDTPVPDDAQTLGEPVDDCGMICWNVAELPPGAVQKGGEEIDPRVREFEVPEPNLAVSAEVSGAIGVAEQLGANEAALQDGASVDPLAEAAPAPAAVVASANAGQVSVIRDGHLR